MNSGSDLGVPLWMDILHEKRWLKPQRLLVFTKESSETRADIPPAGHPTSLFVAIISVVKGCLAFSKSTRSSSREVRTRAPSLFSAVYFSRGTLPPPKKTR